MPREIPWPLSKNIASSRFSNKPEVIRAGRLEEQEARAASTSREDPSRVIQTALSGDPSPTTMKGLPVLLSALAEGDLDRIEDYIYS